MRYEVEIFTSNAQWDWRVIDTLTGKVSYTAERGYPDPDRAARDALLMREIYNTALDRVR